ncbi:MAG: sodium:calcium antiporter, partial [Pseudomonadales bacterium]
MPIVMLLGGFLLLGLGAELLVRGASGLAIRLGVSPIVVGLTIVSLGTSAPELAVSIKSTLAGYSALALGNVVGSNIANIGLVLGVMALVSPIYIKRGSVMRDIPVAIGSFVLLLLLLLIDGELTFIDGLALTTGLVAFIIYCYMTDGKEGEVSPPEVV